MNAVSINSIFFGCCARSQVSLSFVRSPLLIASSSVSNCDPPPVPSLGKFILFHLLGAVTSARLAGSGKYAGKHMLELWRELSSLSAACSLIASPPWLPLGWRIRDAQAAFHQPPPGITARGSGRRSGLPIAPHPPAHPLLITHLASSPHPVLCKCI